jgi:hypothetical protein
MRFHVAVLAVSFCTPALAADPHITSADRAKLIRYLQDSQTEFLSYIDGISDAQWTWKSAPERWSVAETAEHLVLAESFLFDLAQKAIASTPNPDWEVQTKGKTESPVGWPNMTRHFVLAF